jgi:hypothetical protein
MSASSSGSSSLSVWTGRRTGSTSSGGSSSSGSSSSSSGSSSSSDSTDTSAASSSSTVDDDSDTSSDAPEISNEEREHRDYEAKMGSLALRHIKPEHLDDALNHYASKISKGLKKGDLSADDVNGMSDEEHASMFEKIAQANPKIAREPAKRAPLKSVGKRRY